MDFQPGDLIVLQDPYIREQLWKHPIRVLDCSERSWFRAGEVLTVLEVEEKELHLLHPNGLDGWCAPHYFKHAGD